MDFSETRPVPLWIDNKAVQSSVLFSVTNTSSGSVISACGATPDLVRKAVDSSHRAFDGWRNTTIWQRQDLLLRAAQLLKERRSEVATLLAIETPIGEFVANEINIQGSIDLLKELGCQVDQTTGGTLHQSKQSADTLVMVVKEPLGVQLGIAPWNAPLLLGLRAVATPIACGNTAILKASELTPLVHHFIGVLFRDAGFPAGVLNVVQHRREDAAVVLNTLISDNRVRKINFTGSTVVGKIIAAKAAEYCKPVLLELGGKSPQIVLADADLDKAAHAAAIGAFTHHGQICMSTERIVVSEAVMPQFAEKLSEVASKFEVNPGVSVENASKVASLVADAVDHGAKFLYGEKVEQQGSHLTPRILTNVTRDMNIWHTETFGPIALLVSFRSVDEAIDMANDCAYGLSASIFTANIPHAIALSRRLESGAVHINSMTIHDEAHLPHGGTKNSGWGRFGVPWGFSEFTQLKTITITDSHFGGASVA